MKGKITSCAGYLPEKRVTNDELSKTVDTTDEWIRERTGITQRFLVSNGQKTSDLAFNAATLALNKINCTHIDGIILATTTPDLTFPSTACIVQKMLMESGVSSNFAFDIQAVCSGFVYATAMANSLIQSGTAKNLLVIGADSLSNILDWTDRETCVLFGDGAGAIVLESTKFDDISGIIDCNLYSDGSHSDLLYTTGGVSATKTSGFIKMKGREVFRHAVSKMSQGIEETLQKSGFSKDDVKFIVAHQANERILDAVAHKLQIPDEKFIKTVQKHANTSAASIPLALSDLLESRISALNHGDLVVFEALGAGLTWGSILLKW